MNTKIRYPWIDKFRIFAAFLVVAIHTYPLRSFGELANVISVRILARVAVPFFFCVTGYFIAADFWYENANKRLFHFIRKTMITYAAAILIYLPINLYAGHFKTICDRRDVIRILLFDGTLYHLWYLPAAVLGICIVYGMSRCMNVESAFICSCLLYAIGLGGDSYYGMVSRIPFLTSIYETIFKTATYTRNGLFFAPIFLTMGAFLKKGYDTKLRTAGFILFLTGMVSEGIFLYRHGIPRHDSMYIMLVPVVYYLMKILIQKTDAVIIWKERFWNDFSAVVYLIHPWFIMVVRALAGIMGCKDELQEHSLLQFAAVLVLTAAFAGTISWYMEILREQNYKKGRAWIEIDTSAVLKNVLSIQKQLPEGCKLMAVVKADAYGTGAVPLVKLLKQNGIEDFCVAAIKEGIRLRKAGVRGEILILGYTDPSQFLLLKWYRLTQTILNVEYGRRMEASGLHLKGHMKIDSGMHRLGESIEEKEAILAMCKSKGLKVTGMFTHFAASDEGNEDSRRFTKYQKKKFLALKSYLEEQGIKNLKYHMLSSYGIWNYSDETAGQYARAGIALLGIDSSEDAQRFSEIPLFPVVSLKSRVVLIREIKKEETAGYARLFKAQRDSKIAVLSIGYADGIPRNLSDGKGEVLICGKRAPIIGRICMDQMLIDVTDIEFVVPGMEAVLIGTSENESISAEDVARRAKTITNELMSRLGKRLERIYV